MISYKPPIVKPGFELEGSVNLVGANGARFGAEEGARILTSRPPHPALAPDPALPSDTRL
jgi:hypothetical protein